MIKEMTKEMTKEMSKETTEEVTKEATEEATNKPAESGMRKEENQKKQAASHSVRKKGTGGKEKEAARNAGKHTDKHTDRHTGKHTDKHTDRHTGKHTDKHTDRHTGKHTAKHTGKQIDQDARKKAARKKRMKKAMAEKKKRRYSRRFLGKYDQHKQRWLREGVGLAGIFILTFMVFRFVLGVSSVSGNSMYPTLKNGEIVIYNRMVSEYGYGDIVSVWMPSGDYYVKRVAALPGDVVEIRDGVLYVNGEAEEEPYVYGRTEPQEGPVEYPYTVEEGKVFVLGDNREASVDSRTFGAVVESQIRGRLFFAGHALNEGEEETAQQEKNT